MIIYVYSTYVFMIQNVATKTTSCLESLVGCNDGREPKHQLLQHST